MLEQSWLAHNGQPARTASYTYTYTYGHQATISYSTPPELANTNVTVVWRLGSPFIDVATPSGIVVARHVLAAHGVGAMVRDHVHVTALDLAAMNAATSAPPD